jgi:hypothetical protein
VRGTNYLNVDFRDHIGGIKNLCGITATMISSTHDQLLDPLAAAGRNGSNGVSRPGLNYVEPSKHFPCAGGCADIEMLVGIIILW